MRTGILTLALLLAGCESPEVVARTGTNVVVRHAESTATARVFAVGTEACAPQAAHFHTSLARPWGMRETVFECR